MTVLKFKRNIQIHCLGKTKNFSALEVVLFMLRICFKYLLDFMRSLLMSLLQYAVKETVTKVSVVTRRSKCLFKNHISGSNSSNIQQEWLCATKG